MTDAPVATIREREIWRVVKKPNAHGFMEKVKEFRGKETVREAFCYKHRKHAKTYTGENEHGWVFFCPGDKNERPDGLEGQIEGHYFIARRPPGVV